MYILDHLNDLNVPFSRLKLEAVLAEAVGRAENPTATVITVLKRFSPRNVASKALLPSLFSGLPFDYALQVAPPYGSSRTHKNNLVTGPKSIRE